MYTFDTNPIIYYIDDESATVATLDDIFGQAVPLYTSTITELELFSYPALTEEEEIRIEALLRRVRNGAANSARITPIRCADADPGPAIRGIWARFFDH